MTYYNPLDKFYKSQTGAVCADSLIKFRVKGDFDSVLLLLKKDGQSGFDRHLMNKCYDFFELDIKFSVGLYFYCFKISNGKYIGNVNFEGVVCDNPEFFQLTCYDKNYSVPDWITGGVIYQIFPDRFFRSKQEKSVPDYKILHENWSDIPVFLPNEEGKIINNDFFGGDLLGIIEKLDYISSLGVNVIYLNPIFKAFSNHRYDTGDFMQIDPLLGTIEDFKLLIKKAEEKGIKIILDGVFNHTGDDSVYFNKYGRYDSVGAFQSKDSKYYNWYNFINYPNNYESWWGIKTLPAINETNDDYVQFITGKDGVLEHYTALGIGGWRLDVVDELPSTFVKNIRSAVKGVNQNAVVIGEVWEDVSNKISYGVRREYFQGGELDSAMNYPLKNAMINYVKSGDVKELSYTIKEQLDHYPHKSLHAMMNLLSTHDTERLLTVIGGEDSKGKTKIQLSKTEIKSEDLALAKFKLKVASLLQFTLCGVPSIYYGDEIGMQGYADPLNRKTYPWGKEDAELLNWYMFLGQLRSKYSAFKTGDFIELYKTNGTFVYKRFDDNSEVLIAINLSDKEIVIEFEGQLTELTNNTVANENYILKENSFAVFVKNPR